MYSYLFLLLVVAPHIVTGRALRLSAVLSVLKPQEEVKNTKALLTKLINKENLSSDQTESLWSLILSDCDSALVGAILVALRSKGETPDEIAGMVRAMKKVCVAGILSAAYDKVPFSLYIPMFINRFC